METVYAYVMFLCQLPPQVPTDALMARPEPGLPQGYRCQVIWAITHCFSAPALAGTWKSGAGNWAWAEPRYSCVGPGHLLPIRLNAHCCQMYWGRAYGTIWLLLDQVQMQTLFICDIWGQDRCCIFGNQCLEWSRGVQVFWSPVCAAGCLGLLTPWSILLYSL